MTSPYGNTSDDATIQNVYDLLQTDKDTLEEIIWLIPDVAQNFDTVPEVFVVEIEGPNRPLITNIIPEFLRTLSNGTRIYVNPIADADVDEFMLRFTTSDVLKAAKLFVEKGGAALLLFAGTNYALMPLGKHAVNPTVQ